MKQKSVKIDWLGSLLFVLALMSGLATLIQSAGRGINTTIDVFIEYIRIPIINLYYYTYYLISIPLFWVALTAVVATSLFLLREVFAKSENLLIDPKLFTKNRIFLTANVSALLVYIAHYGSLFLMSFYLQIIEGYPPLTTGLILMVEPLAVTIFSIVGGWLSDRAGTRDPSVAGLITTGSALLLFSVGLNIDSSALYVVILLGAIGAGIGFFAPSNTNAALSSVPPIAGVSLTAFLE